MSIKRTSLASIKKKELLFIWICLIPLLIGIVLFLLVPIIVGFILSLTDYNGFSSLSFVGLKNYVEIFTEDMVFYKSIGITFYFAIGSVVLGTIFSLAMAMLLNRKMPMRGFWRAVFYIPCVIPGMAIVILWGWMYNVDFGLFNLALRTLGIPRSMWVYGEFSAIPSLWLMGMWTCGNLIIIFLAGLQNVPEVYYEAAEIDGANWVQRFMYITLPMMSPILFYNFLLGMIGGIQAFTPAYALTQGGPNNATLFTVFLIWRDAFSYYRFGYASAISFVFFIIIGIFTILIFKSSNKWVFYEGK
jgi:multiple sugar transport system permease protein